ncbi:hypothetical protein [Methylobacterium sp. J-070]|uniref:hypothetical protein n=1 Tax=Methylobacterium sp. J-070 TaxID=2836650 RepID=UPI001FBB167C|nr:hypothetical protein [Methylobacterium sp. J-070]MCJ2054015.1 hypothetical protein [Methylobacterium sp. J-070]
MTFSASELVDQAVEQLAPMVGTSATSLRAAADAFDAYAAKAPSAMHERIAAVVSEECRNAADCVQVRRAFLQGFRS